MRIIFLDIDGVLNHEQWYCSTECQLISSTDDDTDCYARFFSPVSIQRLNNLISITGAKVVISSSWRTGRTVQKLQQMLEDSGFVGTILDKTPNLRIMTGSVLSSIPRGFEIKEWLEKANRNDTIEKVESYVILDDDTDMLYDQRNNFIEIDSFVGLTSENVATATEILQ